MVKGETGFRKQASKRRRSTCRKKLHSSKYGSNYHGNVEVGEIADKNSLVDIDIVVGDEAVPGPSTSGLQEVSFNMSISERKLAGTNQIISEEPNVDKLPDESPTGYRFMDMNILSNVFDAVARCPGCGNKLKLLQTKKQGISFEMMLSCLNTECQWTYCFWTKERSQKF